LTPSPSAYLEKVQLALYAHQQKKETFLENERKEELARIERERIIKELQEKEDQRLREVEMRRQAQLQLKAARELQQRQAEEREREEQQRLRAEQQRQREEQQRQLAQQTQVYATYGNTTITTKRVAPQVQAPTPSLQEMAAMQPGELYKLLQSIQQANSAKVAVSEPAVTQQSTNTSPTSSFAYNQPVKSYSKRKANTSPQKIQQSPFSVTSNANNYQSVMVAETETIRNSNGHVSTIINMTKPSTPVVQYQAKAQQSPQQRYQQPMASNGRVGVQRQAPVPSTSLQQQLVQRKQQQQQQQQQQANAKKYSILEEQAMAIRQRQKQLQVQQKPQKEGAATTVHNDLRKQQQLATLTAVPIKSINDYSKYSSQIINSLQNARTLYQN
jgi:hypothetical protein